MTRWTSSANENAAAASSICLVTLVELDFESGTVRAHDGVGPLAFGGNTYDGVGQYGGIETVIEDLQIIARPLKLTLSGVDSSLIATTVEETYQNREVSVYVGLLEDGAFVADPEEAWSGRMDTMQIERDHGLAKITLNCEHRLAREPRIARYTHQDQQTFYPGDLFFTRLHQIPHFRSYWGSYPAAHRFEREPGGRPPPRGRRPPGGSPGYAQS